MRCWTWEANPDVVRSTRTIYECASRHFRRINRMSANDFSRFAVAVRSGIGNRGPSIGMSAIPRLTARNDKVIPSAAKDPHRPDRVTSIPDSLFPTEGGRKLQHGLDGVRLGRALVAAIALHARKAKRDAARIVRAALHLVERDLDHELRPNVDDVPFPMRL